MSVGVIDTGCANLASVRFALERLGVDYSVGQDPDALSGAERLILPGVGAAAGAMTRLRARGWDEALAGDERALMGICLGMQLLFEHSEEGDVDCLGLIPGRVEKLPRPENAAWPHMGWNALEQLADDEPLLSGIETGAYVYFVHGFFVPSGPVTRASCSYGRDVSAVVRSGRVAGCQFHPERSGRTGARILANFTGAA